MPLPGKHAARQRDPGGCKEIRSKDNAFGPGITALYCVNPGRPVEVQSIHFDSSKFTPEQAKKWLKDHDFSAANFEPAEGTQAEAPPPEVRAVDIAAEGLPAVLRIDAEAGSLELEAAAGDGTARKRAFAGTAYTGAAMRLDGYGHPVVIDLAGMRMAAKRFPMLRQHDPERIVGFADTSEVTAQRLRLTGHLSGATPAGQEALALADDGFPWQLSVGADVGRMEYVDKGASAKVNGKNMDGPCYVARATSLRECSLVPMGADSGTSATVAGTGGVGTQGGGYQAPNLLPESFAANRSRNDQPVRKENLK